MRSDGPRLLWAAENEAAIAPVRANPDVEDVDGAILASPAVVMALVAQS